MTEYDAGFAEGIAVALSTLQEIFDKPEELVQVLLDTNLNEKIMKKHGVEQYDIDMLQPVFEELRKRQNVTQ